MEESAKATILDIPITDYDLVFRAEFCERSLSDDDISLVMLSFPLVLAIMEEEEARKGSGARCNHKRAGDDSDPNLTCKSDSEGD